jgi:hypothetical protein
VYAELAYSQGGVQFPTGGIPVHTGEPASGPRYFEFEDVSRSGEKPEPTVTVRMKEDKAVSNPPPAPIPGARPPVCYGACHSLMP